MRKALSRISAEDGRTRRPPSEGRDPSALVRTLLRRPMAEVPLDRVPEPRRLRQPADPVPKASCIVYRDGVLTFR